jgi:hypothetical protein
MDDYKGVPEGRKSDKPLTSATKSFRESRISQLKRKRRRRRWLSGVATSVLVAVLAAGVNGVSSGVFRAAHGMIFPSRPKSVSAPHPGKSGTPRPTSPAKGTPAGHGDSPVCLLEMASEYSLDNRVVRAWTFPVGLAPSSSQMAQIDKDHSSADLVNRDLYNDGGYAPFADTQFFLQNICSQPATVTDIWALKSCQPPLDGAIFVGQSQLSEPGSANEGTQLGFDLDSSDPEAMVTNGWNVSQWTQEYASGPLITIPGNKTYEIVIRSIALHSACSFSIQMRILYGKKISIETFTDGGQPFRVGALLPGVLKPGKPKDHPYTGYDMLYVGWNASPWGDGTWTREKPKTW